VNLPDPFARRIENTFGDRGRLFLRSLPGLIDEAAHRWQLSDLHPLERLSYNYIAFAQRGKAEVVLKLGIPDRELTSEIHSLRSFSGRGTVRLLESDSGRGMLLLERLHPGLQLATLTDDMRATHIAADLMLALHRPPPSEPGLIQLSDWVKGFRRLRLRFEGGTGPLDRGLVERAESAANNLLARDYVPQLIHGDLHHFNMVSSERGWLAIDPKGVIGPAEYEVGPFLINPWVVSGVRSDTPALMQARIGILSERLGFEERRMRSWALTHAVLSAWWSLEEHGDWRNAIECAKILAGAQR
jgi:streptomycin 6-kinase